MNVKQKIFVMVGVGSLAVFLITVFFLGFDGEFLIYEIIINDTITEKVTGVKYFFTMPEKGVTGQLISMSSWHSQGVWGEILDYKTNWFGIIAVFNIVLSATGFFLFKDK